jgi:hypothetical protein
MSLLCRNCCVLMLLLLFAGGCATSKSSNTARTATEQLLISNAIDQSLNKIDFRPFQGHAVYLNDKYVECTDKPYLISSVRHRLLVAGATLVDDAAQSEVLLELRSGGIGTDTAESFLGVPEVTLPGMLTLPEIRLLTRSVQKGTAKLGLVAIDARSKQVLGTGGIALSQSDTQNWFVMGVGPFRTGSIDYELQQATGGPAAQVRNWIPSTVAFQPPPDEVDIEGLAADAPQGTQPASFEAPPVPPAIPIQTAE